MIGKTIGNFKIISEIGKGNMGILYLAEHVNLHRPFAVKGLSPLLIQAPDFRERFHQEALNQALLDHPNIVQVTDFFDEDGQILLVMQFVDGQDLGKLIKEKGKLSPNEAILIFKGILQGLQFAHSKGIIHRDIKPSNILIDKNSRPRITDFGISILVGDKRLTSTGATIGTPWYMSPEQIKYPNKIDHRSDIYSAGIILYEMLIGDIPFDGETDFSIKEQQVNTPAPDPHIKCTTIPHTLSKIVLKALAKDPDDRYQNCDEFYKAINEYENYKESPKKRKLLWLFTTTISIFFIGIIAVAIWYIEEVANRAIKAADQAKEIQLQAEKARVAALQTKIDAIRQRVSTMENRDAVAIRAALEDARAFEPDPDAFAERWPDAMRAIAEVRRALETMLAEREAREAEDRLKAELEWQEAEARARKEEARKEEARKEEARKEEARVPAPLVQIGDSYTYESIDDVDNPQSSITTNRTVTSVNNRITWFVVNTKIANDKGRYVHFDHEWNLIGTRNADNSGFDYSPPLKYFDFPLYPGKTWQQETTRTNIITREEKLIIVSGVVGQWEDVTVPINPIKTFRAIKVSLQIEHLNPATEEKIISTDESWYAPSIRRSVKTIKTEKDSKQSLTQLVSYNINFITR